MAVDWLKEHSGKGDRVLAVSELAVLPSEWKRLEAAVRTCPWLNTLQLCHPGQFTYLVCGEFDPGAFGTEQMRAYKAPWDRALSSFRLRASFGTIATPTAPYFWRTNDERIRIFSLPPAYAEGSLGRE